MKLMDVNSTKKMFEDFNNDKYAVGDQIEMVSVLLNYNRMTEDTFDSLPEFETWFNKNKTFVNMLLNDEHDNLPNPTMDMHKMADAINIYLRMSSVEVPTVKVNNSVSMSREEAIDAIKAGIAATHPRISPRTKSNNSFIDPKSAIMTMQLMYEECIINLCEEDILNVSVAGMNSDHTTDYSIVPLFQKTYNVKDEFKKTENFEEYVARLNLGVTAHEFIEEFKNVVLDNYNDFCERYNNDEFEDDDEFNEY